MINPGEVLALIIVVLLVQIAMRMRQESNEVKKSHVTILSGSIFASTLLVRAIDAFMHSSEIRWSAVLGAIGAVVYLASIDPQFSRLLKRTS